MKRALTLAVVVMFVAAGRLVTSNDDEGTKTTEGQLSPLVEVTDLEGRTITNEELVGKITHIHFFATWCGACQQMRPDLDAKVWQRYKDNPNFQMVAVGREHTGRELTGYRDEHDVPYPLAPDPGREIYGQFAAQYIPRDVVIGADGRILTQTIGYDPEALDALSEKIGVALARLEAPGEQQTRSTTRTPVRSNQLYDERADGRQQIRAALERAGQEDKHVLVTWGANWCGWCRHLESQRNTDARISRLMARDYVSINIDVGHRDKHMALAREYGLDFDELYISHMTVLDADGKVLGQKQPDELSVALPSGKKVYSQDRILEFLEAHAPKRE